MKKFLLALLLAAPTARADTQVYPCFSTTANLLTCLVSGYSIVWPAHQGAAGTAMVNDGSGNLAWSTPSMAVGTVVTSGVANDILYVNSTGHLGQNNNFVFTGTDLGIGTSAPGALLDVAGKFQVASSGSYVVCGSSCGSPGFEVDASGDPVVINSVAYAWPSSQGASSTVLTNNGSGTLTWASAGGGGGMAIGGAVSGSTPGSALYIDSSNDLAQDNGNFFWDAADHRLGIGTTTPGTSLDVHSGNVNIDTTTSSAGQITQGGTRLLHTYGTRNTFVGDGAGNFSLTTASAVDNVGIGSASLSTLTTGDGNIALSTQAQYSVTTGRNNVAIGGDTLQTNVSGSSNIAIGYTALQNSTVDDNLAIGVQAGLMNTTGTYMIAIGHTADGSNTTGNRNVAIGQEAISTNTTGSENTAVGYYALKNGTAISNNTALGDSAGENISGTNNTALGITTLYSASGGATYNVAVGESALFSDVSGNQNTAVGVGALFSTTGQNVTAIGFYAGNASTANNNTFIGSGADVSGGAWAGSTAIGYNAKIGASNVMVLGDSTNTSLNVGIGTNAPGARLEIKDGHQKSTQTTAPTAAPTANAGTGATCTVADATDTAGQITLNVVGASSTSGDQCDVTFNTAYGVAPICSLTPANSVAAQQIANVKIYVAASTTALSVEFGSSQGSNITLVWNYYCIETQ